MYKYDNLIIFAGNVGSGSPHSSMHSIYSTIHMVIFEFNSIAGATNMPGEYFYL